jgi:hypothetical protein
LAEPIGPRNRWALSYLLSGAHGNYLIGAPHKVSSLKEVLTAKGGIKALLLPHPTPEQKQASEELFRFTGCYYVAAQKLNDWQMPGYELAEINHTDCRIIYQTNDGHWLLHTPWFELLICRDDTLGRFSHDPQRHIYPLRVHTADASSFLKPVIDLWSELNTAGLPQALLERRIIAYYHRAAPLLTVFDDIEFERNDYETLPPGTRRQLKALLESLNAAPRNASFFHLGNVQIYFARSPRTLTSHPLDHLPFLDNALTIVTPTQYWLYLLNAPLPNTVKQQIAKDFAGRIPFNWRKVERETRKKYPAPDELPTIKQLQDKCRAFYQRRRQRGIVGPRFNAADSDRY